MAKSFSLLSILLPLLFISFTSAHAFLVPGQYGCLGALPPFPITSPCPPLSILPHLGLPPYHAINPYYPHPTLASPYIAPPPYPAMNPCYPYPTLPSPYPLYNQLVGGVSPYYTSQVLGTAPLFNQLQANQVFNQLQANQLFQQQQANQAFNQLEANQLFSQLQANQIFNQQQANQLFMASQLANYLTIPSAIGYPSVCPYASARGVVV